VLADPFTVKIETAGGGAFFNTMDYANAKYIIYRCWESKMPQGSIIAGSSMLNGAQTVPEAEALIKTYKERNHRDTDRYVYIQNRPEWWTRSAVDASSQVLQ